MNEIYIVWPSEKAAARGEVLSLEESVRCCNAEGYRGKLSHVRACDYIVLTNGNDGKRRGIQEHHVAKIGDVSQYSQRTNIPRVVVKFGRPRRINSAVLDQLRWGSNNVKYLKPNDLGYREIAGEIQKALGRRR